MFPAGTNVEFAHVEAPNRVAILNLGAWRRPDDVFGNRVVRVSGRRRGPWRRRPRVEVVAPGGSQRVEWRDEGVYLTGWAELLLEGNWLQE